MATRAAYSIDAELLDEWVELPPMEAARSSHGCGVTDKEGNNTSSKSDSSREYATVYLVRVVDFCP